jgi:hypothetical protein
MCGRARTASSSYNSSLVDSEEYIKIVASKPSGMQAYEQDKIEVSGDLTPAINLRRIFP